MARQFLLQGSAVIRKIQLSAAARQQLQNLVINVDTSKVQQALSQLGTQIQSIFRPIQRAGQSAAGFNKFANAINGVSVAANRAATATKKLDSLFLQVIRKASAFRISTIFINNIFNALNEATRFTLEFDNSLRDINKILRLSDTELQNLGDRLIVIAGQFNQSSEEVAKAAKAAAQAGFFGIDASEAEKVATTISLTAKAALLAQTTTLSFEESLQGLLSISRQTNSSIEDATILLTKFSAVEDASAIDAKELTEVFKRAGTSLSQAFGPNLNNAIGGVAALLERTRQSAPVIGTFFKTLIARLSGTNKEVISAFDELGISITESITGQLKEPFELLVELQDKLQGLSGADSGRIIGKIGGVRQAELFRALLEVLPKRQGAVSRQTELSGAAAKSFALQVEKARQESEKLSSKLNEVQQSFYRFVHSLKETLEPTFISLLDKVKYILDVLNKPLGEGSWAKQLLLIGGSTAIGGLFNQLFGQTITRKFGAQSNGTSPTSVRNVGGVPTVVQQRASMFPRVEKGFNRATEVLRPFSLKAIGASVALGLFGEMLRKWGKEGTDAQNTWLVSVGKLTESFTMLLPFGPKFAILMTSFNVLGGAITNLVARINAGSDSLDGAISFYESELQDNMYNSFRDFLPSFLGTRRNVAESKQGLEELQKRKSAEKFDNGITEKNMASADALLNAFGASVKEFANKFSEDIQKVNSGIASFSLDELKKKIKFDVSELIGTFSDSSAEQLAALLKNKQALAKLGPELSELFSSNAILKNNPNKIKIQSSFSDIITDVATAYAQIEALKRKTSDAPSISDDEIDKEEAIRDSREDMAVASLEALMAEKQLYAVRSKTSVLKDIIGLEEEITKVREDEYLKQIDIIKNQQKINAQRVYDIAATKFNATQGILKILESRGLKEGDKAFDDMSKQLKEASDTAFYAAENLKNFASSKANIDEVTKVERELTQLRLESVAKQFNATQKLIEEESQLVTTRIRQSESIATSISAYEEARMSLERIMNGKNATFDIDSARMAVEFTKRENEIRLAALNEEINAVEKLRKTALEARAKELLSVLSILEQSPDRETDIGKNQIARVRKELASILDAEVGASEELKKLLVERTVLIAKSKTEELNGLAKIFDLEEKIKNERIDGATKLLDLSRSLKDGVRSLFEAQKNLTDSIRQKLDDAANEIKSKRGALASAFDELANARKALFDAARAGKDAFADYTIGLELAEVAARKVLGEFFGLRDQAGALATAYNSVIASAQAAGASEEKLAELRYQAATEQLQLFESLLNEQRSKADKFFTSSGEDRQNFVQGLAAIQQIVSQFSGNIENFRNLDTNQLNDLGRSIISLPQSLRENIAGALDQLPNGVGIAGLTQDQIKEIFQGATLGESESVGIERLSDTIQTVADLTGNVAELNRAQLITQQKSMIDLKANVANAKENVLIAKNALYQAKVDALNTQKAIKEVVNTVDSQIGEYRQEFKQKVDFIVSSITDPMERQAKLTEVMAQAQQTITNILNKTATNVGSVGPDYRIVEQMSSLPSAISSNGPGRDIVNTIGKAINEANNELVLSIDGLKTAISVNWVDNMASNTEALQALASEIAAAAVERLNEIKAEIKIDNTQKINITGATEIVQQIMSALESREFVTQEQLEDIRTTISKIVEDQIRSGSSRPGALFR